MLFGNRFHSRSAAWALLTLVAASSGVAAEPNALRQHHPWGRFSEGSWSLVRVVTETLDASGQVTSTSTTQTKTTLEKVADEGVTLKVETTVEVAGKTLAAPAQITRQGFADETAGQTVAFKSLEPATVTIEGKAVACQSQQIEVAGAGHRKVTLVRYSDQVTPHILRRETVATDAASGATTAETTTEVIALDMPYKVLGDVRSGSYLKTVQKQEQGVTLTLSVHVEDIPGEVVAHVEKLDAEGRPTRRSTLELMGFRVEGQREASGDGGRLDETRRAQRRKERARGQRR